MADFLRFKGAKSVTKQTGDEMRLRRPPNGGDTWQTKRWWGGKGKVVYISAAIFNVQTSGDALQLVIPTDNETTAVTIRHDGLGNFTFSDYRGIDRIAVYNADRSTLLTEYQFPAISGGSILKRTITNPFTTISEVTITGDTVVEDSTTKQYSANVVGTASNLTYTWTVNGGTATNSGGSSSVDWGMPGVANIQVTVGSTDPNFDGDTVTAFRSITINPSFSTRAASATFAYDVTVDSGEFELDGVANAGIAGAVGDVFKFDLSDASLSGHPFKIYTDSSKTTEVTVGVEQEGDILLFTPPIAGTFSYQCANHEDMGGTITVS